MLAVSVENLSKRFRLGTLDREVLLEELRVRWRRLTQRVTEVPHSEPAVPTTIAGPGRSVAPSRDFWALRDINFDIKEGETVGIIGRNGAGKSTLLKILSRITAPTSGRARIRGRVGSLLEVGTGFHPELTGRENVYLYGSILGMRRRELDRKFDEIVDFSEIAEFIDTPIKRYSSGMKVKLAFSVAASLEPEILIVDEALSVGDAKFKEKSARRMKQIIADGRTLLLVSHADQLVSEVCRRCIYLEHGRIVFDGDTALATEKYRSAGNGRPRPVGSAGSQAT